MTATMVDMGVYGEKKPLPDDPSERAAALAAEALKLAEEARRAAARVSEVRASLSLKSPVTSPKAVSQPQTPAVVEQQPIVEARDAKQTKRLSYDPPTSAYYTDPPEGGPNAVRSYGSGELRRDKDGEIIATQDKRFAAPAASPQTVPVVAAEQKPVVDSGIVARSAAPAVPTATTQGEVHTIEEPEPDLFVKMLDAFGVDRLCGVDDEALEKAREKEKNKKQPRKKAVVKSDDASVATARSETTATSKPATGAPVAPAEAKPAAPVAPPAQTAAPVAPVVAPQAPAPVVAPVTAPAPALAPVVETVELPETPEPATSPDVSEPAATGDVDASVTMSTARSKQISAARPKYKNQVLYKPDPFGGEHDDFLPCSCGEENIYDGVIEYAPPEGQFPMEAIDEQPEQTMPISPLATGSAAGSTVHI